MVLVSLVVVLYIELDVHITLYLLLQALKKRVWHIYLQLVVAISGTLVLVLLGLLLLARHTRRPTASPNYLLLLSVHHT